MEIAKPIVTYSGTIAIPEQLRETIARDIPQEGIEWQRSYGRAAKTVFLEAKLIPFSEEHLKESAEKCQLFDKPLLHTYWIECCDVDVYKTSVKDEMLLWITRLQKQGIFDWLVVVLDSSESKKGNKTKLLSRSSTVIDKIKSDFPQSLKNASDKCLSLSDPLKNDSKSNESYIQFLLKMRSSLSSACSRQLTKYEDYIRTQRENRNSPNWNFFHFFSLQEELAFAFEMLGLFDDALVQYDELDALFSQFVINSNVGDIPEWLKCLSEQCDVWHGLCLSKSVFINLRSKIKECKASLLDLRNYLFARQCELLLLQNKPWEVASRSLPFLQNCVNELNTLEIHLTEGAIACWVFLSALEILQKCERYSDSSQMETYSRFTVGLWAYARKKLEELGILCGLMPDMNHTSDCMIQMVSLIAGMGQDPHSDQVPQSPQSRLKEALSKPELFLKQYLEISELTMGTYKHIGHLRSAKLIGKELAFLYMKMNKHQQSLPFLLDLEKTYSAEKWPSLLADIRKHILFCYEVLDDKKKQIRYNSLLAAASSIPEVDRLSFLLSLTNLVTECDSGDDPVILKMDEIFPIIYCEVKKADLNSTFELVLKIESNFLKKVKFEKLIASLTYEPSKKTNESIQRNQCRHSLKANDKRNTSIPELLTFTSSVAVGIKCPNITDCLKRSDSHCLLNMDSDACKSISDFCFFLTNVKIVPGINEFSLQFESATEKCGNYSLTQVYLDWTPNVSFLSQSLPKHICFDVVFEEPELKIVKPVTLTESNDLMSGVFQRISLLLNCGSVAFAENTIFTIKSSRNLTIKLETDVESAMGDEFTVVLKTVLKTFDIFTVPMVVFAKLMNQKDASGTEYQLSLSYSNEEKRCTKTLTTNFHMVPPFMSSFKLHTCNKNKIIEVLIHGLTNTRFELFSPQLHVYEKNENKVEAKKLANFDKRIVVRKDQTIHFTWKFDGYDTKSGSNNVSFNVKYSLLDQFINPCEPHNYEYNFKLSDFETQYTIRAAIEAQKGHEFCRVGSLCYLYVTIERLVPDTSFPSIMYEVVADGSFWNISGRTAGVLNDTSKDVFNLTFEILPLTAGYLPLPSIRLSKYITCEKAQSETVSEAKLIAFDCGQVYNWSRANQINVLPSSGLIVAE